MNRLKLGLALLALIAAFLLFDRAMKIDEENLCRSDATFHGEKCA